MSTSFDSAHFRAVLGHVPTSVVIVTGLDKNGAAQGITIGSFTSVSLEPPMVGFLPGTSSKSWAAIRESGKFCVNVLGADQEEVCWRFAKEGDDRFTGVDWTPSAGGSPIIPGSIAWIDCSLESETTVGDHYFVLGAVESLGHRDDVSDAMIFFKGKVNKVIHPQ